MKTTSAAALVLIGSLLLGGLDVSAQDHILRGDKMPSSPPLYDGLGSHSYSITASVPEAQAYFNQGLRLYYAFNHQEAIRSFREAQRLDPTCAACRWGEALAWGPNINLPMDAPSGAAAKAAVDQALSRKPNASPKERDLIDALATRYDANPEADRSALDRAYADAMQHLAGKYPADREIAVLAAEAVMTRMPWDYWDENSHPRPGIAEALKRLESVIEKDRYHPGACHFYIHAIEKTYPERAIPCAENLANLMPAAGHLVHMPGHIYIRVGRYEDAIKVNEHAVHADETYIKYQNPAMGIYTAGYYPHNYDFLAFAASMIGRSEQAISAAQRVHDLTPAEMLGEPGYTFAQHYSMRRVQLLVRFGKWRRILETEAPGASLLHARALWQYATGRALAATGDLDGARRSLDDLQKSRSSPELAELRLEFNSVPDVLAIAENVLSGLIFAAEGKFDQSIQQLEQGVAREEALLYGEPPEWTIPVRHDLGAVLLMANRAEDAEQVYRADLHRFPVNGWSLYGLAKALRLQGRDTEADAIDAEFEKVWKGADIKITASAF
jgi:tetratricopeptide (TPR) repeat protein